LRALPREPSPLHSITSSARDRTQLSETPVASFDHLVGRYEHFRWHGESKRLRSSKIDGRFEPSSLLKNPRHSECVVIQFFYHESAGAVMRGAFMDQAGLFSYIAPEARVPANHPLRKIRELVRDVLGELNRNLGKLYASEGRGVAGVFTTVVASFGGVRGASNFLIVSVGICPCACNELMVLTAVFLESFCLLSLILICAA
jgi:hypothetical protein